MTAWAEGTPAFCRYRTLSAMPPTLAGVTRLTNDDASWARMVGTSGICCGTPPVNPTPAATYVTPDMTHAAGEPTPVGRADCVDAVVDVGELGQQEVEGAGQGGDHQKRAWPHPDESFQWFRLEAGRLSDVLAHVLEQRLRGLPARGGGQRQWLDEWGRRGEVLGLQRARRGCRRCLGTGECGQRHDELGSVERLQAVLGCRRRAAEVDDHRTVVIDDDVRRT